MKPRRYDWGVPRYPLSADSNIGVPLLFTMANLCAVKPKAPGIRSGGTTGPDKHDRLYERPRPRLPLTAMQAKGPAAPVPRCRSSHFA